MWLGLDWRYVLWTAHHWQGLVAGMRLGHTDVGRGRVAGVGGGVGARVRGRSIGLTTSHSVLVVSLTSRHEGLRGVDHWSHGGVVVWVPHHHHVHGGAVDHVGVVELWDCYGNTRHAEVHGRVHVVAGRRGDCRPIHFQWYPAALALNKIQYMKRHLTWD